jgi:hypothetical protein
MKCSVMAHPPPNHIRASDRLLVPKLDQIPLKKMLVAAHFIVITLTGSRLPSDSMIGLTQGPAKGTCIEISLGPTHLTAVTRSRPNPKPQQLKDLLFTAIYEKGTQETP